MYAAKNLILSYSFIVTQYFQSMITSTEGIKKELLLIEVKHQQYPYLIAYLDIMQFLISIKLPDAPSDKYANSLFVDS